MRLGKWILKTIDGVMFTYTWKFGGPKNDDNKLGEHNKDIASNKEDRDRGKQGG